MALGVDTGTGSNTDTSPLTMTFTTSGANDICVAVFSIDDGGADTLTSVSSSTLGAWTLRTKKATGDGTLYEYYKKATSAVSSEVLTIAYTPDTFCTGAMMAVSGADTTSIFDSGGSSNVPTTVAFNTDALITTNNANTICFAGYRVQAGGSAPGAGFSDPTGGNAGFGFLLEYKIVSSAQTSLDATIGGTGGTDLLGVGDAIFAAGGAPSLVLGWNEGAHDVVLAVPFRHSVGPALALTPATLPPHVAGMAWMERHDQRDRSARVSFDAPPAFARPIVQVTPITMGYQVLPGRDVPRKPVNLEALPAIALTPATLPPRVSGMAWFAPRDRDVPRRVVAVTDPPSLIFQPPMVTWSFQASDTVFLRDPPNDAGPAFGKPPTVQTVGVSGIAWFEPPDRDRPRARVSIETPPAIALVPGTLPPRILGMAWFEPAPDTTSLHKGVDAPPAFGQPIGTPASTISGMAWAGPQEAQRKPKPAFDVAPAAVFYQASLAPAIAWLVSQDALIRPRPRISETAPAGAFTPQTATVGGWFNEPDVLSGRKRAADSMPAQVVRAFAPPVGISGMAWFTPLDEKPRAHLGKDEPVAFGYPYVQNIVVTITDRIIYVGAENRTLSISNESRSIGVGSESVGVVTD